MDMLKCVNSKYARTDFYLDRDSLTIYVQSLIHMQEETTECTLSKEDSLKFAKAIINHFEGTTNE